jgi:hypothetical protein
VLINAHHQGLLDRGERGKYEINAVGENLVALSLPSSQGGGIISKRTTRGSKSKRKVSKKKV